MPLLGLAGLLDWSTGWGAAPQQALGVSPRRRVLSVGPGRAIKRISDAARLARDGDLVQIDGGDYVGDVAVWQQHDIRLQAQGGRVRLMGAGAAAEGKAIWVLRGGRIALQGFDFYGCKVASGNGAGVRLETGAATVHDCAFIGNEMGLLTNNEANTTLDVVGSEFAYNFRRGAHNHNLYAGAIARLTVADSYFHHARTGHLLKSRAAVSDVRYCRLTDEAGGRASYEVEFPNGGEVTLLGNLISQSTGTENNTMVSYGAEGLRWPRNALQMNSNTLIDQRDDAHGVRVFVVPDASVELRAANNLLVGAGRLFAASGALNRATAQVALEAYLAATDANLVPRRGAPLFDAHQPLHDAGPLGLPQREYVHPRHSRALAAPAHNPGALQQLLP